MGSYQTAGLWEGLRGEETFPLLVGAVINILLLFLWGLGFFSGDGVC